MLLLFALAAVFLLYRRSSTADDALPRASTDGERAAYLANCAAAIVVSREGAYSSIPTLKEVLAFAEAHPLR